MAARREEKLLMRTRGAGGRQLADDDFGFSLPGLNPTPAVQRANQSPVANDSVESRRITTIRSSARQTATQVDQNGSVVKKRKVDATQGALSTPIPTLLQGTVAAIPAPEEATSAQRSSSTKKRKRKSISQGAIRNKERERARARASARGVSHAGSDDGDSEEAIAGDVAQRRNQNLRQNHDLDTADAPLVGATASKPGKELGTTRASEQTITSTLNLDGSKPRKQQKARKSTGGPSKRPRRTSTRTKDFNTEDEEERQREFSKPVEPELSQGTAEPAEAESVEDAEDHDNGIQMDMEPDEPEEQIAADSANEPQLQNGARPSIKRKKRRKSVNPIQQERRKKRLSSEAIHHSSESPKTVQRPAKLAGRKLASQSSRSGTLGRAAISRNEAARQRLQKTTTGKSKVLAKTRKAPAPPKAKPSTQDSAEAEARVKGSVPITVYRLQNAPELPTATDPENSDHAPLQYSQPKGPNAVDTLAQVTSEIIQSILEKASAAESNASDRAQKATARRQRTAISDFGTELEARLLDLTQTVDHHASLQSRLRQAKKTHKQLKAELIASRHETDEVEKTAYRLRRRVELAERVAADDKQIVALYKKLGRAMRDARNAQGGDGEVEEGDVAMEGLEYQLRSAEGYSTADGRMGLFGKLRTLNANLEEL